MKARCANPKNAKFAEYGDRGISVCRNWMDSFEAFLSDMGPRPAGTQLDRIKGHLGYSKSNCRWATVAEQQRNRKTTRFITFAGQTLCITDWADRVGLKTNTLWRRLQVSGWTVEEALTTPVRR